MTDKEKLLQAVLNKTTDGKKIFGTSFAVKKNGFIWFGNSGNLSLEQPYFIASTTKLFTTALILHLKSNGKLRLEDKISLYLDKPIMNGLHIYKGKEYSDEITIKHLLSHTSGLPDYFEGKEKSGKSLADDIKKGNDQFWTFEQAIEISKSLKPHFIPGTKNKAHYSDTNFQLLRRIIEIITNKSYSTNCNQLIIKPLNSSKTYLYNDPSDNAPKTLYYKSVELHVPKAMASFGADGGMVSTSTDMLIFIEAFFKGKLFPEEYINDLQEWNNIFFPLKSGVGIHLFQLAKIFNPTGTIPSFIGHSGL
jgi:CubicO group peptidase (beta-lactamase class C family)